MQPTPRASAAAGDPIIAGRYLVEATLGQGGIGVVYAVLDRGTGRRVALKRLLSSDARARALFEREYSIMVSLRHPGIVAVYDYGVDQDGPFYTMELLEGQDLSLAAPRPWPEVCACLRDAASIVGMLHARRLVHRDISPRNLWRTKEGRIKLLDFGMLASFGVESEALGTPPLTAPEIVNKEALDARADLYALGALGYWMLTSAHAFRANTLGELPRLWKQRPARPSELVRLLGADLPEIPEELDALILALLSHDRKARPASSWDVIDRLQAIAQLPADEGLVQSGEAYFASKAFVGRKEVLERAERRMQRADKGRPQALWIEGEEGIGRSRLLEELGNQARLQGALVIAVAGAESTGAYAGASRLALRLFEACPELAAEVAAPYRVALSQVSLELSDRLRAAGLPVPAVAESETHAAKQQALGELLRGAARARLLAIVVDDIDGMDEESQALLAALPLGSGGERLLLMASCRTDETELDGTLSRLRRASTTVRLVALSQPDLVQLLQSIFGDDSPHLGRIAARLHELSGGNPQFCLLLVQELIDTGAARYADGGWDLPKDIQSGGLPESLRATVTGRLDRLDPESREVARWLSGLRHDHFPRAVAEALLAQTGDALAPRLAALTRARVLVETGGAWRFAHRSLREALQSELSVDEQRTVDSRMARWFESGGEGDPLLTRLRAALHWLRASEFDRAHKLLVETLESSEASVSERLRETAPITAELVDGLRRAGRSDTSLAYGLGILCIAGYFVDPSFADRYGARGMAALTYLVPTSMARKLRPFVGRKLALLATLVVASRRVKRQPYPLLMKRTIQLLAGGVAGLTGADSTRMQTRRAQSHVEALEPLTALGERHIVTAAYRVTRELARTCLDVSAEPVQDADELLRWLQEEEDFEGAEADGVSNFILAMRFIRGLRGNFLDRDEALRTAERLEQDGGAMYRLNVQQLRAMHHVSRGEWEQAELCRKRMGVEAIQLGMSWRVDVVAPILTMPAIWARDAVALKRTAGQLERLSAEMPGFVFHRQTAEAAYHVLHGTPETAITLLEGQVLDTPVIAGWARTRGVLAAAYNALGNFESALNTCDRALARLSPEDLEFVGLFVNVQVERVRALSGLGRHDEAARDLGVLLERREGRGPLLHLYLHAAAAELALGRNDPEAFREHLQQAETLARHTHSPGQLLRLRELDYQRRLGEGPFDPSMAGGSLGRSDEHLALRVQLILRTASQDPERLPGKLADVATEITGAQTGFFVLPDSEGNAGAVAVRDGLPDAQALQWAQDRMRQGLDDEDDTADFSEEGSSEDPNLLTLGEMRYCLKIFWAVREGVPVAAGALVLGFSGSEPLLPRNDVLTVMSDCLMWMDNAASRLTSM